MVKPKTGKSWGRVSLHAAPRTHTKLAYLLTREAHAAHAAVLLPPLGGSVGTLQPVGTLDE